MSGLGTRMRALAAIVGALAGLANAGAACAQTSASPFTSGTRYDLAGRVTGTIAPDPDGTGALHHAAVRNTYDVAGRLVRVEKGELAAWQSEAITPAAWTGFTIFSQVDTAYDGLDRKAIELVSSGGTVYQVTQYSYDTVGRSLCTAVRMNNSVFPAVPTTAGTIALGSLQPNACLFGAEGAQGPDRITRNYYDDSGQLLQVRKAVGTSIEQGYVSYTYTPNGKQQTVTDANGNKAQYSYDGHDRLVKWAFPDKVTAGAVSATDFEQYDYDGNGNRTSLRKRDGRTLTFTYDALNRMTSKIVPDACVSGYACTNVPAAMTRDVYYSYDLRGLQTAARFDSVSGTDAVTSVWDGFGRQTSSTTSMGGVSRTLTYQYDSDGNRTRVTNPDGNYFVYTYDGLDRPTAISQNGSATVVTMGWDTQGRRASEGRGAVATTYGYDPISRVNSLTDDLAGTAYDVTTTFGYNPASQITSQTRSNAAYAFGAYSNTTRSYTVNGLNQYTAVAGNSYGYDSNGNLTSDGGIAYTYDAENRLVVTSAGAQLTYDPLGRLYEVYKASTGTTRFLYDGDQLTAEYNASGTLLRRYVHGTGEDDPLLWYEGSGLTDRRSLQIDHQRSIVSIADASGNATSVYTYDEYGVPGGSYAGRFQYTGQAWIPELGMYYYKARIYSPMLGRFLQTDPVGYKDEIDLYTYVGNDPINGRDPTGTEATSSCTGSLTCSGASSPVYVIPGPDLASSVNGAKRGSRSNRGGQGNGEKGRTANADGTSNPGKKFKPAKDPGFKIGKDADGKDLTKGWPQDPRKGGDGTGVHPGSKYPDGAPVFPNGPDNPPGLPTPPASDARSPHRPPSGWWGFGGALLVICYIAEPCGGAVTVGAGIVAGVGAVAAAQ